MGQGEDARFKKNSIYKKNNKGGNYVKNEETERFYID